MSNEPVNNIRALDALRGILAVVVCLAHAWQVFIDPVHGGTTIWSYVFGLSARFAVIGFFCVSGYVIALSVVRNTRQNAGFSSQRYFSSRALRILPPLVFTMLLAILLVELARVLHADQLPAGLRSARDVYAVNVDGQIEAFRSLMIGGDLTGRLNGPLWSLQYEIQFYVLTGLACAALFAKRSLWIRIVALVVFLLYFYFVLCHRATIGILNAPWMWALIFSSGMIASLVRSWVGNLTCCAIGAVGVVVCFWLMATYDSSRILNDLDTAAPILWAQLIFGIGFSFVLVRLTRSGWGNWFSSIGEFSYTLYIVHFPLMLFGYFLVVNRWDGYSLAAGWMLWGIASVVCIVLARALSGVLENQQGQRAFFLQLSRRLRFR